MTRRFTGPPPAQPQTQLMAIGDWSTMVTTAGSGYSHWRGLAVSRWTEDNVRDESGNFTLLRDVTSGALWSATWQPVACTAPWPSRYAVVFAETCARFERCDGFISSVLEVVPARHGDGEVRRIELHNAGDDERAVDVISWMPLVLGPASADATHPAYSKMFVQTGREEDGGILLAWRRKHDPSAPSIFAAHLCTTQDQNVQDMGFETDRMRFIGRGRSLCDPAALDTAMPPTGQVGSVLDPVFSLRRRITLAPGATARLAFWTLAADSRTGVLERARACRAPDATQRAFAARAGIAAPRRAQAPLNEADIDAFQRLAGALLYSDRTLRAGARQIARAAGGPPALWRHGISGDRPIVVAYISQIDQLELARQLLAAQRWWEQAGLNTDLALIVIAQKDEARTLAGSLQALQKELRNGPSKTPGSGELFVLQDSGLSDAERDGLAATARIVLDGCRGNLEAQLQHAESSPMRPQHIRQPACSVQSAAAKMHTDAAGDGSDPAHELEFFNGLGGFSANGHEYVIELPAHQCTPLPWINVIANPGFGFLVSAEGGGYSWAINSQTNSLTPWSNDPVLDPPGDVLYMRDNDDGALWSATPSPVRTGARCEVRHGHGYTRFRQQVHAIASDLLQFVPGDDPVKISRLRLKNTSNETRHLQITAYVQWALGANGELAAPHIVTAHDDDSGALTARNDWRADYMGRVAFADLGGLQTRWTCDRREFLGTWGNLSQPAALMHDTRLSGTCGAGIEPCAALQAEVVLPAGKTIEIVFVLGEAADDQQMRKLVARYRAAAPERLLDEVCRRWRDVTGAVQVKTPDRRLDLLVNGWLPYQIISCRLHARTAFYQASGAWGFRDQLQDVAALPLSAPRLVREHLLRAAGRQFLEGDVQHWWLPPTGAGSRTHKVDDRLWLPLATAHYVNTTNDTSVLDEPVAFLEGKPIPPDKADDFYLPEMSPERASLFEHCARAIEASLLTGPHGLPLFGTGDWNDGMNLVGYRGRGESVWMAWFLIATIRDFAPLADARGAHDRATKWRQHAAALADAAHTHAWDGHWWLRGWYDDGTPLGSHASHECRIDSIAQSWSVISSGTSNDRGQQAMEAVNRMLVRRDARVVALLTPPFDTASQEPGYIKGYPSGLRENGGQYTHGSAWAAIAFAMLGDGDRAWELFDMLEPISHADTPEAMARWKVEPYVACADVYTAPQHLGRGGWTWYTGSAGWLYRTAVEWLLGIHVQGAALRINPCIPHTWSGFSVELRWHSALYRIQVDNPSQICRNLARLSVDGIYHDPQCAVTLCDDHATHQINAALG